MVTPFLHIWISQQKSPEKGTWNFNDPTLPPSPKTSPGETWTQLLVIAWLISLESPEARLTDHGKYDFSLIAPTSNYKVKIFTSDLPVIVKSTHPHTTLLKFTLFSTACRRSKKTIHPWGLTRKSWAHLVSLFPWLTSESGANSYSPLPAEDLGPLDFEIWFSNHLTTDITFNKINLKHCITNIKFLEWDRVAFLLPWSNAT